MLRALLDWAKSQVSRSAPPTREQAQDAAQEKREDRASLVTSLQAEVRSLQQAITDLTSGQESGIEDPKPLADRRKLDALERQLEQKQQELGRLQGRV